MLSHLLASVEILRPHNMLASGLCVLAGYHVAGGAGVEAATTAALLTALATGAGNVINDYFDLEIDRVNKPRRPLPSGRISRRAALVLYSVLCVVVVVGAVTLLPQRVTGLVLLWLVALFGYAAGVKRVFFAGNFLVAAITSSAFVAGAMLTENVSSSLVPFLIAFFFVMSRELVKGAEDLRGDEAGSVRTFAVVLGVGHTVTIAAVMMLALAVLIPLPSLLRYYGGKYFVTMAVLVIPGLIVGAGMILGNAERKTFNRVSWLLKLGMFFGILAIALGKM